MDLFDVCSLAATPEDRSSPLLRASMAIHWISSRFTPEPIPGRAMYLYGAPRDTDSAMIRLKAMAGAVSASGT
jgi:hypothetical protein